MKQIVLKPDFRYESVIYNNEVCKIISVDKIYIFLQKPNKQLISLEWNKINIIESPEEQKDCAHPNVLHGKCHTCDAQLYPLGWNGEMPCGCMLKQKQFGKITEISGLPPVGYCKCGGELEVHEGNEGTGCFGKCKKCSHDPNNPTVKENLTVADAEKVIAKCEHNIQMVSACVKCGFGSHPVADEKPPLKLRVGGVYKNRMGETEKIVYKNYFPTNGFDEYTAQSGRSFHEDGRYHSGVSKFDLIEEVQPEQKYTQEQVKAAVNAALLAPDIAKCIMKDNCDCDKCKKFVAENATGGKEAVEYCECKRARVYYSITPDICGICKKPFNEEIQEKENLKYRRRFMDHMRKAASNNCVYIIHLEDKLKALEKPEGNPFKVGEFARAFACDQFPSSWEYKGEVKKIVGDAVLISVVPITEPNPANHWFHYKQCERVE